MSTCIETNSEETEANFPARSRSRTKFAVLSLLSSNLFLVVVNLIGLFSTPLLLRWLGTERFGLHRVLDGLAVYLGIPAASAVSAAGVALLPRLNKGNKQAINSLLGASGFVLLALACLSALLGIFVVGPLLSWLASGPVELSQERWWAWLIRCGGMVLLPLSFLFSLLNADQRSYLVQLLQTLQSVCLTGFALLLAWAGWGLPGQSMAALIATTLQFLLIALVARSIYPWLAPWRINWEEIFSLSKSVVTFLGLTALGVALLNTEQLIVNWFGGPSSVTNYILNYKLIFMSLSPVTALSGAVWAPLGDLFHKGEQEAFLRRTRDCFHLLCGLAYAGSIATFAFTGHFIRLWVGEEYYAGTWVTLAFLLMTPIQALWVFHGWLLVATGHNRKALLCVTVRALVLLGCCFLFGSLLGPYGVAWGMVISSAGVLFFLNLIILRTTLQIPWWDLLGPYLMATLLGVPAGVLACWLALSLTSPGWVGVAIAMVCCALVYLVLYWWLVLTSAERESWKQLLFSLLNRA